jgi:two-component system NtrC family sensor kinase
MPMPRSRQRARNAKKNAAFRFPCACRGAGRFDARVETTRVRAGLTGRALLAYRGDGRHHVRLARKITFAIAGAILVVMAAHAYFLIRHEVVLFDADLTRSTHLKKALRASIETVWRAYGDVEAQRLVEDTISEAIEGVTIRWLWLDAPAGDRRHLDLPPELLAQLREGERVVAFRRDTGEDPQRFTYVPMSIEGSRPAVLEVIESIRGEHAFIEASRLQVEGATVVILLSCAAAVYVLGLWFVGRPIQRLRDKLRAIAAGNFDTPLELHQNDEIGELAQEINLTCARLADAQRRLAAATDDRIAALEQMRHTDRLTTIGQLAAGVAHELGTPLSVVSGRAEMIASGEAEGERALASARVIVEQASQMTRLIRQLLDFSRRHSARSGLVSLRAIATRTIDMLAAVARRRHVAIALHAGDDPLLVFADESQLQQALANVIMNAVQAMPNGGRVDVALTARRLHPPGDAAREHEFVCATVADTGEGIPQDALPHIFEPFFTTKDRGEGTGLGLSVARGIVSEHGGWIDVESEVHHGSRFAIMLPRAAEAGTGEAA